VREDGPGGGGAEDDGDDSAGATAAWTVEDVGAERPAEELGPGDGTAGTSGTSLWGEVKGRGLVCDRQGRGRWRGRDDGGPQPGIGSEERGREGVPSVPSGFPNRAWGSIPPILQTAPRERPRPTKECRRLARALMISRSSRLQD
jgi:hypothetical protein